MMDTEDGHGGPCGSRAEPLSLRALREKGPGEQAIFFVSMTRRLTASFTTASVQFCPA